jgi:hypothetical protein
MRGWVIGPIRMEHSLPAIHDGTVMLNPNPQVFIPREAFLPV